MAKGSTYQGQLLKLLLNATAIANVADNAASAPLTNLSISLHTADPGEGNLQSNNEVAYAAYNRINTSRTSAALVGWSITSASGNCTASPLQAVTFPQVTSAGSSLSVITHFGVGSSSGAGGYIFYKGTVTPNITLGQNVTPSLTSGSSITET